MRATRKCQSSPARVIPLINILINWGAYLDEQTQIHILRFWLRSTNLSIPLMTYVLALERVISIDYYARETYLSIAFEKSFNYSH